MRSAPAHYAPAMSLEVPTLYDWAGGDDAFTRLINAFYDRVEQDDLLSPFFPGGVNQQHREHVTIWWREVSAARPNTPEPSADTRACWLIIGASTSRLNNGCGSRP